jgi:hypothetical protein
MTLAAPGAMPWGGAEGGTTMRRWTLALPCLLLATGAAAADTGADNPMPGWKPPRLTQESRDKQEITALFTKMDQAGKKGDVEAAAALVDFPVLMVTDDSKGEAHDVSWSREQWTEVMKRLYAKPMNVTVHHRSTVSVLSDSLATVVDHATFEMGGRSVTARSSSLLVKKGGEWKIKSMSEGGWGDSMSAAMAKGASPSSAQTGAGQAQ